MPQAFDTIVVPTVPGARIATTEVNADSATFTTTETVVATVVAPLVTGRTYAVRFVGAFAGSVVDDRLFARIREDSVSGTQVTAANVQITTTNVNGNPLVMEGPHVAGSTASKTFVLTGVRVAGTGNGNLRGTSTQKALLYVDYIEG